MSSRNAMSWEDVSGRWMKWASKVKNKHPQLLAGAESPRKEDVMGKFQRRTGLNPEGEAANPKEDPY